jgi:integrase
LRKVDLVYSCFPTVSGLQPTACPVHLTDETSRRRRNGARRRTTKTGRSRSFPLHPDLLKVLRTLPQNGSMVFSDPRGGPLQPDRVRRVLVEKVLGPLAKQFPGPPGEAGFADGRLHSFRHYFCSTCANHGVPKQMVMRGLGHRSSEMVRHYYHLHDEEAQRRMR